MTSLDFEVHGGVRGRLGLEAEVVGRLGSPWPWTIRFCGHWPLLAEDLRFRPPVRQRDLDALVLRFSFAGSSYLIVSCVSSGCSIKKHSFSPSSTTKNACIVGRLVGILRRRRRGILVVKRCAAAARGGWRGGPWWSVSRLLPCIAARRFAAGAARLDCSATVKRVPNPIIEPSAASLCVNV